LTGRPPFQAETIEAIFHQLLNHELVAPRLLNPSMARLGKRLSEMPGERSAAPVLAQELADDLGRWLNNEPVVARPAGLGGKFIKSCRRRPAIATLGAATLLAVSLGLAGILWQWREAFPGQSPACGKSRRAVSPASERSVLQE
jgi:hypothetical protein